MRPFYQVLANELWVTDMDLPGTGALEPRLTPPHSLLLSYQLQAPSSEKGILWRGWHRRKVEETQVPKHAFENLEIRSGTDTRPRNTRGENKSLSEMRQFSVLLFLEKFSLNLRNTHARNKHIIVHIFNKRMCSKSIRIAVGDFGRMAQGMEIQRNLCITHRHSQQRVIIRVNDSYALSYSPMVTHTSLIRLKKDGREKRKKVNKNYKLQLFFSSRVKLHALSCNTRVNKQIVIIVHRTEDHY